MDERATIAILGAGMAGAAAARRLATMGRAVHVFDKGRGVGGRMASRRTDTGQRFDHGAAYFRAKGAAFAAQCDAWVRSGIAAPWGTEGRHVGVPGMTAPVRDLLAGLPVSTGVTIARIARDGAGWRLTDAAGTAHGPFAAVAITFPAPQVAALLAASGLGLPGPDRARYAPCWSLMLAGDTGPDIADGRLEPEGGAIGLVTREASKPGRDGGAGLVVHASAAWSRARLEDPAEAVRAALIAELEGLLGRAVRPAAATVHRWRYARVETALGEACVYDAGQRLGAAGDWCLGARIEAAFDSGRALAERIAADLGDGR